MRSKLRAGRAVWLSGLVGLAGCYNRSAVDPGSVSLNPHPTELIDVSGVVAAPLRVDKLHLDYQTHSWLPFCNGLDFPDGGTFARHLEVDVPMVQAAGQLTAKVAADRYAGICGWRLSNIAAVIRDGDRASWDDEIAANPVYGLQRPATGGPPDQVIVYCGYTTTEFYCGFVSDGDKRYLPVILDRAHRDVKFDIRLDHYPPPPGYRPLCSNDPRVPYPPCKPSGR